MAGIAEAPRYPRSGKPIESLRSGIVRAQHWEDLFPSKDAEMADFVTRLVGGTKAQYEEEQGLKAYRIVRRAEGDIHIVERTKDLGTSTFQKLTANGNVIITFAHRDTARGYFVTPSVGNIAHAFTAANIVLPSMDVLLKHVPVQELEGVAGMGIVMVDFDLRGKPATQGWEETMLHNDAVPQRIGHRIYSDFALQAQARLLAAYPHLFQQS